MRKLLALLAVVAAMGAQSARADEYEQDPAAQQMAESQQDAQVSPDVFEGQLGPYGQWIPDPRYGEVFYPNVSADWRPYLYGHWAWTSYGWMWVSDEPFGWAVYHYGRWWFNPALQRWGWVPGYEWAPAWVVWRFGATSVGWAPLYVGYDTWVDTYPIYYDHWVYVPCEHFYGVPVYHYAYPVSYASNCYHDTHSVHGYVGASGYGPPPTYVAAHTAIPVTTTPVVHSAVPPKGGVHGSGPVAVYQPPHTSVYNPTRPSPTPVRGPGAAHTPVVAPPSTHVPAVVAGAPGARAPSRPGVPGSSHGAWSVGGNGRPGIPGGVAGAGTPTRPGIPGGLPAAHGSPNPAGSVPVAAGARPGQVQVPARPVGGSSPSSPGTASSPGSHVPVYAGGQPGRVQIPGRIPGGGSASNPGSPSNPGGSGTTPRPGTGHVPVSQPPQTASSGEPSRFGYPQYTPLRPPAYVKDPHTPVSPSGPARTWSQPANAQRPTSAQPTYSTQRTYSAPSHAQPTYNAQRTSFPSQRTYSAPSYALPQRSTPTASYGTQRSYSAPRSYTAAQRTYSAPTYSTPQRSYSAPNFGASRTMNRAPTFNTARTYSAPGGGFRAAAPQRSFGSFGGSRAMPTVSSTQSQHRSSSGGGSRPAPARRR